MPGEIIPRRHQDPSGSWTMFSFAGEDVVQLHQPPETDLEHFTIFWRGRARLVDFYEYLALCVNDESECIGIVANYSDRVLRIPPHPIKGGFHAAEEQAVFDKYGEPNSVRYEVYSRNRCSEDLNASRFAIWGNVKESATTVEEVGAFLTNAELLNENTHSALRTFMVASSELKQEAAEKLLKAIESDLGRGQNNGEDSNGR